MNPELIFNEYYPHSITKVWAALTDPKAISQWLMETDFEPKVGHKFICWSKNESGEIGRIECQLLLMEPPRRMVWSWKGNGMEAPTQLLFELEPGDGGTYLTLTHSGKGGLPAAGQKRPGWPPKFTNLDSWLDTKL